MIPLPVPILPCPVLSLERSSTLSCLVVILDTDRGVKTNLKERMTCPVDISVVPLLDLWFVQPNRNIIALLHQKTPWPPASRAMAASLRTLGCCKPASDIDPSSSYFFPGAFFFAFNLAFFSVRPDGILWIFPLPDPNRIPYPCVPVRQSIRPTYVKESHLPHTTSFFKPLEPQRN